VTRYIERSFNPTDREAGWRRRARKGGGKDAFWFGERDETYEKEETYEQETTTRCERDRAHTCAGRAHMRAPGARVGDCARAHGRAAGRCFRLLSMTPICFSHKVGEGGHSGLGEEQKKASARVAGTWARSEAFSWLSNSNSWEGTAHHHQLLARALCRRTPSFCLSHLCDDTPCPAFACMHPSAKRANPRSEASGKEWTPASRPVGLPSVPHCWRHSSLCQHVVGLFQGQSLAVIAAHRPAPYVRAHNTCECDKADRPATRSFMAMSGSSDSSAMGTCPLTQIMCLSQTLEPAEDPRAYAETGKDSLAT
jgi:hypothetical protein